MSRTPRLFAAVSLAAASLLAMTGCTAGGAPTAGGTDGEVQRIVVATAAEPRPYTFFNEQNELTGYDIELLKKADELLADYEFSFEPTDFQGLFAGLDSGRYHVVANNLSATAERREKYDFSDPYLTAQFGIGVADGSGITAVSSLNDLAGKTTYGQSGLNFTKVLEAYNEANPDAQITIEYTELDLQSQFTNLAAGQVDFIFSERVVFDGYGKSDPVYTFLPLDGAYLTDNFGTNLNSAFAISKQTPNGAEFIEALNGAIAELKADGTLTALSEEYFGTDLSPKE